MKGKSMKFYNELLARAKSGKKTGAVIDSNFELMCKVIDYINSLDENAVICFEGQDLADLEIPVEFKSFILPKSIRFEVGSKVAVNVVDRPSSALNAPCTLLEFQNAWIDFRSAYKISGYGESVTVGELRKDLNIFDIWNKVSFDDGSGTCRCVGTKEGYIPIPITCNLTSFIRSSVFNETEYQSGCDYLKDFMFDHPIRK